MKSRKIRLMTAVLLLAGAFVFTLSGQNCFAAENNAAISLNEDKNDDSVPAISENVDLASRLLELLPASKKAKSEKRLAVGGSVFGIRIDELGVSVVNSKSSCPLKAGDRILSVNGKKAECESDVENAVRSSNGKLISFEIIRDEENIKISVIPRLEDGVYKIGASLRANSAGLGTITFIDPETGAFGGLGHGVCDAATGNLIPIESGMTTNVVLGGIKKGECGKPGELSGILAKSSTGTVESNTSCGIFGTLKNFNADTCELYELGLRDEIHTGKAEIISSVKNGKSARYSIEITEIDTKSEGSKSFKIKVTDETLIALTGGIVRGM